MLYCIPETGVTVMVPVACEQLCGCCAEACGAAGAALAELIVTGVAPDTQPALFFTVTL